MAKGKKHAFDLHSQKGVADLLAHVRTSALPAATKTTIRELVLKYAQRGGDVGVREELEAMLDGLPLAGQELPSADASAQVKTESATGAVSMAGKRSRFTIGRPVPKFAPVSVQKKEASKKEKATLKPVPAGPGAAPKLEPAPAPEPAPATPAEPAVAAEPVSSASEQKPTPEPVPESTPESKSEPESTPEPVPVTGGGNLARIQEIKREVIALVGNPVNLVNTNNEVGREYMSALLDAMKKSNAGTKVQSTEAMARLEAAFAAVERVVAAEAVASSIEPEPASEPAPATPAEPAVAAEPVSSASEQKPTPEPVPESTPESKSEPESTPEPVPAATGEEDSADPQKAADVDEVPEQKLGNAPLKDIPAHGFSKPPEPASRPEIEPSMPKVPPPPPLGEPLAAQQKSESLAADSQKEDSDGDTQELKTPEVPLSKMTAVPKAHRFAEGDGSLMDPDITAGLEQLLSEWKIFKSSGLFGMGPSGIDHPLYLAIKDTSMLSVDKGNFEGSTEEIQQSISDYLNGWRYEQAIVYQHTETFEHFLRRVVKRILSKTKQA